MDYQHLQQIFSNLPPGFVYVENQNGKLNIYQRDERGSLFNGESTELLPPLAITQPLLRRIEQLEKANTKKKYDQSAFKQEIINEIKRIKNMSPEDLIQNTSGSLHQPFFALPYSGSLPYTDAPPLIPTFTIITTSAELNMKYTYSAYFYFLTAVTLYISGKTNDFETMQKRNI